jgi:proline dehydrogenase
MITRDILLYLAGQQAMRNFVTNFGLSRRAALRFVAGEDVDTAMQSVAQLNSQGVLATLDYLGEDVASPEDALKAAADYVHLVDKIAQSGVQSNVSLKLSQLGLRAGQPFCQSCVAQVLEQASLKNNFVRIDMEGSDCTEQTLQLYRELRRERDNVGIVLQSYLYRTAKDIEQLIDEGLAHVRLCKGAYKEPASVAFPRKQDVDGNYVALMERMLSAEAREKGSYLAIATHDSKIIDKARHFVAENNVPRDAFEFQMLYGIRRDLQRQLSAEGYRLRIYVPYGKEWYPYYMRRLAERPANILFIVRALISER